MRDALAKDRRIQHEKQPEYGYARISIDLGASEYVGTDIPLAFSGDQLAKIKYTGSTTGTYFRLNNRHAQQIFASEFKRSNIPFTKIYLTNPSAQDAVLNFYIGTGIFAAIQPSGSGAGSELIGLTDSDGVTINPATEDKQDTQETSLDAILAKIIASPATEAKQDTQETSLDAILAKIIAAPATSAYQALVLNMLKENVDPLLVTEFQAGTSTGTFDNPTNINDNNVATFVLADVVNEYIETDLLKTRKISQYRAYGSADMTGDGRWKIQYWDIATLGWVDWITDIVLRNTATWTAWTVGATAIVTNRIRIVMTTLDTNGVFDSMMAEVEMKY